MPRAFLLALPLVAASAVLAGADSAHAPMQVSVQVVRSCRVQSGGATASIECGRQPATVQVSTDGGAPSLKTVDGESSRQATPVAETPSGTRTLVVNF